ncbi:MAG: hypothetical protein ACTSU2_09195 [Promethearchaeota archaeon]
MFRRALERRIKLEEFFKLKRINVIVLLMFLLSAALVFIFNILPNYDQIKNQSIRILYFESWLFFQDPQNLGIYYYMATILFIIAGLIFFKDMWDYRKGLYNKRAEVKNINEGGEKVGIEGGPSKEMGSISENEETLNWKELMYSTPLYLGVGAIFEVIYLLFNSDLRGSWEVMGQFYITLDTLAVVILLYVVSQIFLMESNENSPFYQFTIIFLLVVFFFSYVMMLIYGLAPDKFSVGIILAIGLILVVIIFTLVIIVNIGKMMKRIGDEYKRPLLFIALELLFLILSLSALIGCGITIFFTDLFLNRFLRVLRAIFILMSAISFRPAYVEPMKKKDNPS